MVFCYMSTRHLHKNLEIKKAFIDRMHTNKWYKKSEMMKAELKLYHRQFQRYFRMLAGQLEALLRMRDERAAAT